MAIRHLLYSNIVPDNAVLTVNSVAPIRICDNGGWTDTWFARHGRVFNIAVSPHAEVQMHIRPRGDSGSKRITIHAENYGERYTIDEPRGVYDKHPLLEAALDYMHIPQEVAIEVSIFSEAPVGCSTGTSAAVPTRCTFPSGPHSTTASASGVRLPVMGYNVRAFTASSAEAGSIRKASR